MVESYLRANRFVPKSKLPLHISQSFDSLGQFITSLERILLYIFLIILSSQRNTLLSLHPVSCNLYIKIRDQKQAGHGQCICLSLKMTGCLFKNKSCRSKSPETYWTNSFYSKFTSFRTVVQTSDI